VHCGRLLDLVQPKADSFDFDPPTPKTYPMIKNEVERMTPCENIATWIFQDDGRPPSWI